MMAVSDGSSQGISTPCSIKKALNSLCVLRGAAAGVVAAAAAEDDDPAPDEAEPVLEDAMFLDFFFFWKAQRHDTRRGNRLRLSRSLGLLFLCKFGGPARVVNDVIANNKQQTYCFRLDCLCSRRGSRQKPRVCCADHSRDNTTNSSGFCSCQWRPHCWRSTC